MGPPIPLSGSAAAPQQAAPHPIRLKATTVDSSVDRRRGIVRLHPEVLASLGAGPLDPLLLAGKRQTGALAALFDKSYPWDVLLCDDLVLANLGVADGSPVQVARVPVLAARSVLVSGPPRVAAAVPPDMVRLTMLGKAVSRGDRVSLLEQDFSLPPGSDREAMGTARREIASHLGAEWQQVLLTAADVQPAGVPAIVTMRTVVAWESGVSTETSATPVVGAPSELPGLESQVASLTEWFELGFFGHEALEKLGGIPEMGVLVTGPPGSGKAAVAQVAARALGAGLVQAWGPKLAAFEANAAVSALSDLIERAESAFPSVLLVEDVEKLLPRDQIALSSVALDVLRSTITRGRVGVVCTSAHPEELDPAVRQPGALVHELSVAVPTREVRLDILRVQTRPMPLADDVDLRAVAARTPGFVAADLLALCREAALQAAHRNRVPAPAGNDLAHVTYSDFEAALESVRATAMGDAVVEPSGVMLDDVGDMESVKRVLTETVLWPLEKPDTFSRLGIQPARGVLMYGPPGCGKTFLVSALASMGEANLLAVKGAELLSKWVGESERQVRELFRRAREAAPTIVFLDELDALAPVRGASTDSGATDRVVASILTELDGLEELRNVFVIGATNRPDLIDTALLRPGRLEHLVYVPPPDSEARAAVLRAASRHTPFAADVDLDKIAALCEGCSAADLAGLVRSAALCAMRESMEAGTVTDAHLQAALRELRPSLDQDMVERLARFSASR